MKRHSKKKLKRPETEQIEPPWTEKQARLGFTLFVALVISVPWCLFLHMIMKHGG